MRKINLFSGVFGALGLGLMIFGLLLAVGSREARPVLKISHQAIQQEITDAMDEVCRGDYAAAAEKMYGTPDFGLDRSARDPLGQKIWEAFSSSIRYELVGELYQTDGGLAQDLVVETLDISSVTAPLGSYTQQLLTWYVEQAEDQTEIYDENMDFRKELVDKVMLEAVQLALEQDAKQLRREITVNLIYENGGWWILPDSALLDAISGGILQ